MTQPLRRLEVVDNVMPEPPYPADVRAKGWRFELDIERIKQSRSWMLCRPPEMRSHMLRLWMEAWVQAPAGTLPADDDELIAALIDMDPRLFLAHRDILLRGWYRASDGLLYHPVITELVEEMRDGRKHDREKKARQRANKVAEGDASGEMSPGTTPMSPGTPEGLPGCPPTGTGTGTGTGSNTEGIGTGIGARSKRQPAAAAPASKPRSVKKAPQEFLIGVELQQWARKECPLVDIRAETATFRDHTFATGKTDWPGTWRNWMRKEQKRLAEAAKRGAKVSGLSPYQQRQQSTLSALTGGLIGGTNVTALGFGNADDTIEG